MSQGPQAAPLHPPHARRSGGAPQHDGRAARFYAVVARDTVDQDFAAHRQRFLAEQGYAYRIVDADDVLHGDIDPKPAP